MNMAKKSNHAALLGERQKELKFDDSVTATGAKFIPVSFDTHGSWGPKFKVLFRDIIKHASEYSHIPVPALAAYWSRRLSISLHRGIANSILRHIGCSNASPFYDEGGMRGAVMEQAYLGSNVYLQ